MDKSGTGLRSSLKLLYSSYGGWRALVRSEYVYVAAVVTGLCWRWILSGEWVVFAQAALPTLAGFSIAAYAVFFAVLDEKARLALKAPASALGGRSPILILASAVSHTVVVQLAALLFSLVFKSRPFPMLPGWEQAADVTNVLAAFFGAFLTVYGVTLVLASVLSIFRILEIGTKVK